MEPRSCQYSQQVCTLMGSVRCTTCQGIWYCSKLHRRADWYFHKRRCTAYMRISEHHMFGNLWVASRDLPAGVLLVQESPIFKIPVWPEKQGDYRLMATCLGCGLYLMLPNAPYRCSKCSWPVCSEGCEMLSPHCEAECAAFANYGFQFPPPLDVCNPEKISFLITILRANVLKTRNNLLFKILLHLQHVPNVDPPRTVKELAQVFVATRNTRGFEGLELQVTNVELRRLYWILRLNSVACFRKEKDKILHYVCCLYMNTSIFCHSCSPNCYAAESPLYPEFKMFVRTASPVQRDQPLTISYIGASCMPTFRRQRLISDKYFFTCRCHRCLDPTELSTFLMGVVCPFCVDTKTPLLPPPVLNGNGDELEAASSSSSSSTGLGYMLPKDPLGTEEANAVYECHMCHALVPQTEVMDRINPLAELLKVRPVNFQYYVNVLQDERMLYLHPNHWVKQFIWNWMIKYYNKYAQRAGEDSSLYVACALPKLTLEETFNPGYSLSKANMQRNYVMTMSMGRLQRPNLPALEASTHIFRCLSYITEAQQFYEVFSDSVYEAEEYLKILGSLRKYMNQRLQNLPLYG